MSVLRRLSPLVRIRIAITTALVCAVAWPGTGQDTPISPAPSPEAPVERTPDALTPTRADGARLGRDQIIPVPELEAFVDGVVKVAMERDHLVGVTVAVVQAGETAMKKGYGFADLRAGRRVDPDATLFRIGSVTKTFTWIALMQQIEAGRMGLDDPVNLHLPADQQIPDEGQSEPIRIRHLMTHSPGFEDRVLGEIFLRDPAKLRPLGATVRERRPDRVRAPGVLSSYSNYGVVVAGAIVEHAAQQPWSDVVDERILAPLQLTHTTTREPYAPREDLPDPMPEHLARELALGYRWTGAAHQPADREYITHVGPAGVMSSTARDMSRYMLMLLNDGALDGVTVFGPQAATAFRTRMTSLPPDAGNWAGGFWETRLPGGFLNVGHDGATLSFFSSMVLAPELRLGIFVAANTAGGDRLTGSLAARIVEQFYASTEEPASARSALVQETGAYASEYLSTRRRYGGLEGFLFRLMPVEVAITPDGYLRVFDQRFVPGERPDEFRAVNEASGPIRGLRVVREGDRVERIETFVMTLERQSLLYQSQTLLTLAGVTLAMSIGTLFGARIRFRRGLTQTPAQRLAGWFQGLTAIAWLATAVAAAALVMALANNAAYVVFFGWPHPALLALSTAALTATVLAVASAVLLPSVWRRSDSSVGWTWGRKLRFSIATAVSVLLGTVLTLWGALQPWNP
jgi:CubicO group peptidase (beta-lactamase class C family)